jgi:heme exporter protein A
MTDLISRLEVHGLALVRGERVVLSELNFQIAAGETLSVGGPNGSGKTSLLRAIAGLLEPRSGRILLHRSDASVIENGEERGALVGWLGHQDGVKPQMTPREHLKFHANYYRLNGDVAGALADAGLAGLSDVPAQYLSAGQRRRLALARLMLTTRPLWLLDEPFSALDAQGRELVRRRICEHCGGGGIAVAATHEPLGIPSATLELA